MAIFKTIDHETGDLTQWDIAQGSGRSVLSAAALNGTSYGLRVTAGSGTESVASVTLPPDIFRFSFRIDISSLVITDNPSGLSIFELNDVNWRWLLAVSYEAQVGEDPMLYCKYATDDGVSHQVSRSINNGDVEVQIQINRSSASGIADGSFRWYIDGMLYDLALNQAIYDYYVTVDRLHLFGTSPLNITGTFDVDEIFFCSGIEICPPDTPPPPPPPPPTQEKILSLSTPFEGGDTYWVTLWDGANLKAQKRDMASSLLLGEYDFGACTEAELESSKVAYALAISDSQVYIYGRFDRSGIEHIAKTTDGGAGWLTVASGYGTDIVGAFTPAGNYFAVGSNLYPFDITSDAIGTAIAAPITAQYGTLGYNSYSSKIYIADNSTVYSYDGVAWTDITGTLSSTNINRLLVIAGDTYPDGSEEGGSGSGGDSGSGGYTPPYTLPSHGSKHEYYPGTIPVDPTNVYPRALTPLKVWPADGLRVNVGMYRRVVDGEIVTFHGVADLNLSSYKPTVAGEARYVVVGLNTKTNTVQVVAGASTAGTPEFPTIPEWMIASAAVYLKEDATQLYEYNFIALRNILGASDNSSACTKTILPLGKSKTIDYNCQYIVYGNYTIEGELTIYGDLVVL
ncbi:MAG: hypothetical protein DSY80_00505 [Desulfocapsa sp.]|nr:MAG: hypothetical protein DSY80_00505 [Desulfocapsa sp.]